MARKEPTAYDGALRAVAYEGVRAVYMAVAVVVGMGLGIVAVLSDSRESLTGVTIAVGALMVTAGIFATLYVIYNVKDDGDSTKCMCGRTVLRPTDRDC